MILINKHCMRLQLQRLHCQILTDTIALHQWEHLAQQKKQHSGNSTHPFPTSTFKHLLALCRNALVYLEMHCSCHLICILPSPKSLQRLWQTPCPKQTGSLPVNFRPLGWILFPLKRLTPHLNPEGFHQIFFTSGIRFWHPLSVGPNVEFPPPLTPPLPPYFPSFHSLVNYN